MNTNFLVTCDAIYLWYSHVTSAHMKIVGKSPHSWPKKSSFTLIHTLCYISYKVNAMAAADLGPLLLTWFNFDPGMDK